MPKNCTNEINSPKFALGKYLWNVFKNRSNEIRTNKIIFYFSPVAVQLLLEQFGADPNLTNSLGMTALHDGVSRKDLEIVRTLIKFGADPTIKSIKDDKSPLDMAAEKDLNEISQVLKTSSYLHNNNALLNGKLDSVATELDSISLTPEVSIFLFKKKYNLLAQN